MRLVQVEWVDSFCDASWRDVDTAKSDAAEVVNRRHLTVGFLVTDTNSHVLVASSWAESRGPVGTQVADTMLIPQECIRGISDLHLVEHDDKGNGC